MYVLSEVDPVVGGFTAFTICKVPPSTRDGDATTQYYVHPSYSPAHTQNCRP